jgi:hypothetical protein
MPAVFMLGARGGGASCRLSAEIRCRASAKPKLLSNGMRPEARLEDNLHVQSKNLEGYRTFVINAFAVISTDRDLFKQCFVFSIFNSMRVLNTLLPFYFAKIRILLH